jgi:hypothetical protein
MYDTALPYDSRNLSPHQGLVVIRIDVPAGVSGSVVGFTLGGKDEPYGEAQPGQARTKVTYEPRVNAGGEGWLHRSLYPFDDGGKRSSSRTERGILSHAGTWFWRWQIKKVEHTLTLNLTVNMLD